ncbi:hypothetical protein ACIPW4_27130 [Pseudomonas sp. NPDC089996]|uniref:hypothetical protein n=1 Tax=Pseudomonas sp. NPDC089996 TaxID=3364474 RepID=UPI0037F5C379
MAPSPLVPFRRPLVRSMRGPAPAQVCCPLANIAPSHVRQRLLTTEVLASLNPILQQ